MNVMILLVRERSGLIECVIHKYMNFDVKSRIRRQSIGDCDSNQVILPYTRLSTALHDNLISIAVIRVVCEMSSVPSVAC